MGFSVLLDIAGSMIIGLIVLTMIGRINNNIAENTFNASAQFKNQGNITYGVQAIEGDIRKIGMSINYTNPFDLSTALLLADTSSIKFLADLNRDGTMDTVYYYLGPTSDLSATQNPKDRYIYRKVNSGSPFKAADGVIALYFQYYNKADSSVSAPVSSTNRKNVRSIGFNISVAPSDSIKGINPGQEAFPVMTWQTKIMARNLYKQDI